MSVRKVVEAERRVQSEKQEPHMVMWEKTTKIE